MSYRYALAQLGDKDSLDWMLKQAELLKTAPKVDSPDRGNWEKSKGISSGEIGPFCNLLVKLDKPETLSAYMDLLMKEAGNRVQSSISAQSLFLIRDPAVVDSLGRYFQEYGKQEYDMDLTLPKRALALYPDNLKAMKLLEEFVPDKEKRDDLLSIASEFGAKGLNPDASLFFGREKPE
jgi:hypothetical protein